MSFGSHSTIISLTALGILGLCSCGGNGTKSGTLEGADNAHTEAATDSTIADNHNSNENIGSENSSTGKAIRYVFSKTEGNNLDVNFLNELRVGVYRAKEIICEYPNGTQENDEKKGVKPECKITAYKDDGNIYFQMVVTNIEGSPMGRNYHCKANSRGELVDYCDIKNYTETTDNGTIRRTKQVMTDYDNEGRIIRTVTTTYAYDAQNLITKELANIENIDPVYGDKYEGYEKMETTFAYHPNKTLAQATIKSTDEQNDTYESAYKYDNKGHQTYIKCCYIEGCTEETISAVPNADGGVDSVYNLTSADWHENYFTRYNTKGFATKIVKEGEPIKVWDAKLYNGIAPENVHKLGDLMMAQVVITKQEGNAVVDYMLDDDQLSVWSTCKVEKQQPDGTWVEDTEHKAISILNIAELY